MVTLKYKRSNDSYGLRMEDWGPDLLSRTWAGQLTWRNRFGVWVSSQYDPGRRLLLHGHCLVLRVGSPLSSEVLVQYDKRLGLWYYTTPLSPDWAGQLLEAIVCNQ